MTKYRALLFDLFDTVALIRREKLPPFEWNGVTTRSTTAALRELYESEVPDIPFADFVGALTDVAREQQEARAHDLREVPCELRFTRTLLRAGLTKCASTERVAEKLAAIHCSVLANAVVVPPEHVSFLAETRARYPLALVSNFDHAATARDILRETAVLDHFSHVVISVEHGWRKPYQRIFSDALTLLGVEPHEALFVGDAPYEDVAGAKRTGMDVAWVNPDGVALPSDVPAPDYIVTAIPAVRHIL